MLADVPPLPIGVAADPLFATPSQRHFPRPAMLGVDPAGASHAHTLKRNISMHVRVRSADDPHRAWLRGWRGDVGRQHAKLAEILPASQGLSQAFSQPSALTQPRATGNEPAGQSILAASRAHGAKSAVGAMAAKRRLAEAERVGTAARVSKAVRASRSFEDSLVPPAAFDRFAVAELESVEHVAADMVALGWQEGPLVDPHVVAQAASSSRHTVLDEGGRPIVWPWEQQAPASALAAAAARQHSGYMPVWQIAASGKWDSVINDALDRASADGKRGRGSTGVRAWFAFHRDLGEPPVRPLDPMAPLMFKLVEEWRCMEFVCALVEERGVAVDTARSYFSSVQGWHARETGIKLAGGLKLERLPAMLKGLRRKHGDKHKPQRVAFAPKDLRRALDALLNPAEPLHANLRAAITTAFQALMRSAEYCGTTGKMMLTRADIVCFNEAVEMVLMMHPCKNMHHLAGKTCPVVIGAGGKYIDAVAEVANLRRVDPVDESREGVTPLFRDPATNKPLSYELVNEWTKKLGAYLGFPLDRVGTHCWRISGATALFAAGGNDMLIRTMGRWSSDLHRLYVRCCYAACARWGARMGSAEVSTQSVVFDEVDEY